MICGALAVPLLFLNDCALIAHMAKRSSVLQVVFDASVTNLERFLANNGDGNCEAVGSATAVAETEGGTQITLWRCLRLNSRQGARSSPSG